MSKKNIEEILYAITAENHNYVKYIVIGMIKTREEAKKKKITFEAKKHNQDYYVIPYKRSERFETFDGYLQLDKL